MANSYSIGGENSGHIIMLNYLPTGDGMLAAIMLLNVLTSCNKSLKELTSELKIYPDKLVNLKVKDKNIIKNELVVNKVNEFINLYNKNIQPVILSVLLQNPDTQDNHAKLFPDILHLVQKFWIIATEPQFSPFPFWEHDT